ncbi:ATP-dependent helicase HrpB [Paenibacillus abyssi]|uniref:ATP-dependent helicase HrpB n=1 Tax=Paenibacillus abyssi TaxID=1340531 RepID=A0A917D6N5_9BACL|nr:ATP-dependent helicase HrpB [Paenibacillus abyssi]GGG11584.1 ATP-dependent helicase HrpB [Paenibacillus abyssi]
MSELPIDKVVPSLKSTLSVRNSAVLVAAPGAGKTTRVPLALLNEPWLNGKKIVMLEPRRLAARAAAHYMSSALGEPTGATVGYRVRMDTKVGPNTRIEVVTEGVLTRMLQVDQALEGVGLIIFDEFHERSLHADLGLALSLQTQQLLRDELRLLVMSATLETDKVAKLLNDAPVIRSEGRVFPVQTLFTQQQIEEKIETAVARTIFRALSEQKEGDLLVFLPGAGEINRVRRLLEEQNLSRTIAITPLHGNLSLEAQDAAIKRSADGKRKIVLSTSIAESSLTVEGVHIVIDSGRMRVPRFSPRTGMTRLETVAVSRASADQRRGRAGRLGPGVCYRLWTEEEDRMLEESGVPEIREADLAPFVLELASWGVTEPDELLWLDPPPEAAYQQAVQLLQQLGAIDQTGKPTEHGRRLASAGGHPRLSHMIVRAAKLGLGPEACMLAALLGERDLLRMSGGRAEVDMRLRMEALAGVELPGYTVDHALRRRILAEAQQWQQSFDIPRSGERIRHFDKCGLLLAFAYPDRIAKGRSGGRFLLRNGRGAVITDLQVLSNSPYLAAAELDDIGADSRIQLAAPIELPDMEFYFKEELITESSVAWDRELRTVKAKEQVRLGALVIKERQQSAPDAEAVAAALTDAVRQEGLDLLPWTKQARQYQQRNRFMQEIDPAWPSMDEENLLETLDEWLLPHLVGMRSGNDLQRLQVKAVLELMLSWQQQRILEDAAPTYITVPSGSRIPVDYTDSSAPAIAVRLQEVFGLLRTPSIGNGKIPVILHLLSPAQRPVQVTRDLESFWSTTYFEVKKDLKGRYPKHYWPEDPLVAMPTSRVRPRT